MANTFEPGIGGVLQRLNTIRANVDGLSNNSSIDTAKTNIDNLITNLTSDGWLVNPTTSAVTVTEQAFFHSGGTTVGDFSVTGPKAYFSGSTWVFSGSATGYPNISYISAKISRLATATTGSTQGGFTGNVQTYSASTSDWFTGFTKTGTTSFTGVGFTVFVTGSTSTNNKEGSDNHAVMSGTCSGVTTQYLATQIGFEQQMSEGIDRLRALSSQLNTMKSQKGIKNTIFTIKKHMIAEVDRISFIMREGNITGVFPGNWSGNEGQGASEQRIEKDYRKVGGVNLSAGDSPQRRSD